ncbi:MAG: EAL domain-containing protein [Acidimicrobiales bacterium]
MRHRGEVDAVSLVTKALDHDEFCLHARPIVRVGHAWRPSHVEILVRMNAPDDGAVLTPDEFLPAAERFGLAHRLDLWVVMHTLEALRRAPAITTCAINLSGVSLGRSTFLQEVSELLDASDIDPGRVCFEITETAAITNGGYADSFISSLRARGCRFALDDFGSGLASFAYLKNLDVDFLKIDGSFVQNILTEEVDGAPRW